MLYQFKDIIGNVSCIQLIKKSLDTGSFPQISIMGGTMGTGKSSTAKAVALALTCDTIREHKYEPCCECIACKNAIASFTSTGKSSYIKIFNAGQMTEISDVKDMLEQIFTRDNGLHANVYIIEEAHALSTIKNAQTMLLDELDRMPSNSYLILTTTNVNKIEKTIRSRAITFNFHRLSTVESRELIDRICDKKHYSISDRDVVDIIARNAQGIPRNIERALDFISGAKPTKEELLDFFQQISDMEFLNILVGMIQEDALLYAQNIDSLCNSYESELVVREFKNYIARKYFEVMSSTRESHILSDLEWDDLIKYVSTWTEDMSASDLRLKFINLRLKIRKTTTADLFNTKNAISAQNECAGSSQTFTANEYAKEQEKLNQPNKIKKNSPQDIAKQKGFI